MSERNSADRCTTPVARRNCDRLSAKLRIQRGEWEDHHCDGSLLRAAQHKGLRRPGDLPDWLTCDVYVQRVQPALTHVAKSRIRSALARIWEGHP